MIDDLSARALRIAMSGVLDDDPHIIADMQARIERADAEIARLTAALADMTADYLRRHKDATDRTEELIACKIERDVYRDKWHAEVQQHGNDNITSYELLEKAEAQVVRLTEDVSILSGEVRIQVAEVARLKGELIEALTGSYPESRP